MRIELAEWNQKLKRVLEKNRLAREGLHKNAVYKNGEIYDLCLFGKLK